MDEWPHRLRPAEDDSERTRLADPSSPGVSTTMTTPPRRFFIRNRDNLAQILVEGCVWSNGGISTIYHPCPWIESSSTARTRALATERWLAHPYPEDIANLEDLAASVWGELDWLDKSDEELVGIVERAQANINSAWQEAHAAMTADIFEPRPLLDWRDPVAVVREQRSSRGLDDLSGNESGSDKAEEDSEKLRRIEEHSFAPGTVIFAEPVFDSEGVLEKVVLTSRMNGTRPVGIVDRSGQISSRGFIREPFHGFDVGQAHFEEAMAEGDRRIALTRNVGQAHFGPEKGVVVSENFGGVLFGDFRSQAQIAKDEADSSISAPPSPGPIPVPTEGAAEPVDPPQGSAGSWLLP